MPLEKVNVAGHPQVLLTKVKFPVQFWQIFASEQILQLLTLQLMHKLFKSVKPEEQTQFPPETINVAGHPQVLLAKVKFPVQF